MPDSRLYVADMERNRDMLPATPRQRVSMDRSVPLALTGAWQAVPFAAGASARDVNTFPVSRYDYANQLILANPMTGYEQAYNLSLDLSVNLNASNVYVKLAVRFVVPAPTPIYFPLPESQGRIDLPDQLMPPNGAVHFDYTVYTNAAIKDYGAQVQVRATTYQLSGSGLLGGLIGLVTTVLSGNQRPTLTDAVMNMYAL